VGKLDGKVAFITGVARGQGRSHAVLLASEGANIVGVDICGPIGSVRYPLASIEDLDETVALVEAQGSKMIARRADVRHQGQLAEAFQEGREAFGQCDIVLANAGFIAGGYGETDPVAAWQDSIDVLLSGVWNTLRVTTPSMIEQGEGGAIVITGSTGSFKGMSDGSGGMDGYHAAKHGVLGLMRSYANLLAPHRIRVNTVHPTGVNTPMVVNENFGQWVEAYPEIAQTFRNALPVELIEPIDVSRAVLYLVSDDGRYVTGHSLAVDAGFLNRL
jgi:SDR family mycofactocin-dependent oxidoreductase